MNRRISPFYGVLSTLVLLLFVGIGSVSCATSQSTTAANAPANLTPAQTTTVASVGTQQCGTITYRLNGQYSDQVHQSGQCFWQAFSQCQPASLVYVMNGVDTSTRSTFSVVKQSAHCTITDASQHRTIPRPARPVQTFTCTNVTSDGKALQFLGCGTDGNITVPIQ